MTSKKSSSKKRPLTSKEKAVGERMVRRIRKQSKPVPVVEAKHSVVGFGYSPEESEAHFEVWIPTSKKEDVRVHECLEKLDDQSLDPTYNKSCQRRLTVPRTRWELVAPVVAQAFNEVLATSKMKPGAFQVNKAVYLSRLLGKELMVLLWALEDASNDTEINNAIANWRGCDQPTRWWLYALTDATHGAEAQRGQGWRRALYYGLASHRNIAKPQEG